MGRISPPVTEKSCSWFRVLRQKEIRGPASGAHVGMSSTGSLGGKDYCQPVARRGYIQVTGLFQDLHSDLDPKVPTSTLMSSDCC